MRVQLDKVQVGANFTLFPAGRLAEGAAPPKNAPRVRVLERRANGSFLLESLNGLRMGSVHVPSGRKMTLPRALAEKLEFHGEDPKLTESRPAATARGNDLAEIARRITGRKSMTESAPVATISQEEADRRYEEMKNRTVGVSPDDPALAKLDEAAKKEQIDADSAYLRLKSSLSGGATAAAAHGG